MSDIKKLYMKPKKAPKPKAKPLGNIRIIDDDVSVNDLIPDNLGNTLDDDLYVNEPVIAEIIDERPDIVKQLEPYTNSKWKRLADDNLDVIKIEPTDVFMNELNNKRQTDNDGDFEFVRRPKSRDTREHRIERSEEKVSKVKAEKNMEEEVDETQVRVRKPTQQELEKKARQEERKKQYAEWGKGLKQKKDREEKLESDLKEAEKPLARYKDDKDLEKLLRERERQDDPMLKYLSKKDDENEDSDKPVVEKRKYKGVALANRYNILPGYRWDGVDRSNGFEKKYFQSVANRKTRDEEAYKWSVEDM